MKESNACPCDPKRTFSLCCEPIITLQQRAKSAEALLRARYSAMVKQRIDFLVETHHPETKNEVDEKGLREWAMQSDWHGLTIHRIEGGGEQDEEAVIYFTAEYTEKNQLHKHSEQSFFRKSKGDWMFLDAKGIHFGTYRREGPKLGRNDACPCKSGKKVKHCCGLN